MTKSLLKKYNTRCVSLETHDLNRLTETIKSFRFLTLALEEVSVTEKLLNVMGGNPNLSNLKIINNELTRRFNVSYPNISTESRLVDDLKKNVSSKIDEWVNISKNIINTATFRETVYQSNTVLDAFDDLSNDIQSTIHTLIPNLTVDDVDKFNVDLDIKLKSIRYRKEEIHHWDYVTCLTWQRNCVKSIDVTMDNIKKMSITIENLHKYITDLNKSKFFDVRAGQTIDDGNTLVSDNMRSMMANMKGMSEKMQFILNAIASIVKYQREFIMAQIQYMDLLIKFVKAEMHYGKLQLRSMGVKV